ncbi:hypothetical protein AB1Y20_023495 [Prymnesium parvum]|uniref:Protein xylosyltransferase n=1 Tax=Prymnesium parvum TaxID=97485 RepID=A0AB34JGI9_PRYPA
MASSPTPRRCCACPPYLPQQGEQPADDWYARTRRSSSSSSDDDDDDSCATLEDACALLSCAPAAPRRAAPCCVAACIVCALAAALLALVLRVASRAVSPLRHASGGSLGPPLRAFARAPSQVDAVFMWVNGSHPRFRQQLDAARRARQLPYEPHAARYRDDGLLQYAVLSLLSAPRLVGALRHVYVVTSGEVPAFVGGGGAEGFTDRVLSVPLQGLLDRCGRQGGRRPVGGERRRLFIVPHAALFSDQEMELPTFNSNAVLAAIHKLPHLGEWFLYSDDDMLFTNRYLRMSHWWDERVRAQRLQLDSRNAVHRTRAHSNNNWEQAMTFMSGLLDALPYPPHAPGNSSPAVDPGIHHTSSWGRWTAQLFGQTQSPLGQLVRSYDKPMHVPVLFSRDIIIEMEARWPREFERTRQSRVRSASDLELNFLYHHYLRLLRFPVLSASGIRARFLFIQECAEPDGRQRCAQALRGGRYNFVCFNDGASSDADQKAGAVAVRELLQQHFNSCRIH